MSDNRRWVVRPHANVCRPRKVSIRRLPLGRDAEGGGGVGDADSQGYLARLRQKTRKMV